MVGLLVLVVLVLDVIALVDIVKSTMTAGGKVVWTLVVVVLPVIGMLLYFAFGKKT